MNRNHCVDLLRRANAHLERFFARCSHQITPHPEEDLRILLQVERMVRSVGALLDKGLKPSDEIVTRKELSRYRANLVRLRHELARMQADAHGCQARLFTSPKRVAAPNAGGAPTTAVN